MTEVPFIHRNQSIDLLFKAIDWFLYDRDLHHERANCDIWTGPVNIYVLNNGTTAARSEIWPKLIKVSEKRYWRRNYVFIINFEPYALNRFHNSWRVICSSAIYI